MPKFEHGAWVLSAEEAEYEAQEKRFAAAKTALQEMIFALPPSRRQHLPELQSSVGGLLSLFSGQFRAAGQYKHILHLMEQVWPSVQDRQALAALVRLAFPNVADHIRSNTHILATFIEGNVNPFATIAPAIASTTSKPAAAAESPAAERQSDTFKSPADVAPPAPATVP